MNRLFIAIVFIALFFSTVIGGDRPGGFKPEVTVPHTSVLSQGSTGTCWSFATTSFLESEIIRKGFPETDLSEMFFVYHAYLNKARKYLLYHGRNNFGQGGQAHDVIDVLSDYGMLPDKDFPGEKIDGRFRHRDLVNELNKEVVRLNKKRKNFELTDIESLESILEEHIGRIPRKTKTSNGRVTPVEFREMLAINPSDYVELTSYSHHPFYEPFVLEVPDNWSHSLYYNLPLNELMQVMTYSIKNGFTFCWDGDTSEELFSHKKAIARLNEKYEGKVDQELRQKTFFNRKTTDDHLMHVVGLSKNEKGETAFYTKNSWGEKSNNFGGYLHMTENYVKLKTIAILVHKDAIPEKIRQKLNL